MNLTAKPRRGDMGGHANQYFTSSTTGWKSMRTGEVRPILSGDSFFVFQCYSYFLLFCFLHNLQEDVLEAVDHAEMTSVLCLSTHTCRNSLKILLLTEIIIVSKADGRYWIVPFGATDQLSSVSQHQHTWCSLAALRTANMSFSCKLCYTQGHLE